MHADHDVLARGHVVEEANVLERAADAPLGDRVRRLARHVLAAELDLPGGRLVDAGEHVEERRLAGAVRADQAGDRAFGDREVDVVDGDEPAELLPEVLRSEQVRIHSGAPRTS